MTKQYDKFHIDLFHSHIFLLGELMREKCVCGFSTVDNISLLNLEGTGMIGVPGIAQRLFGKISQ